MSLSIKLWADSFYWKYRVLVVCTAPAHIEKVSKSTERNGLNLATVLVFSPSHSVSYIGIVQLDMRIGLCQSIGVDICCLIPFHCQLFLVLGGLSERPLVKKKLGDDGWLKDQKSKKWNDLESHSILADKQIPHFSLYRDRVEKK